MNKRIVNDPSARYFIKSQDGYWLTDNRSHSAVESQRVAMDFRTAVREIEEAQKWNPSCRIVDAQGVILQHTKTIEGRFRPVGLTRDLFIERWTSHFSEFYKLARDVADYTELDAMKKRIAQYAGCEWDRLPIEKE